MTPSQSYPGLQLTMSGAPEREFRRCREIHPKLAPPGCLARNWEEFVTDHVLPVIEWIKSTGQRTYDAGNPLHIEIYQPAGFEGHPIRKRSWFEVEDCEKNHDYLLEGFAEAVQRIKDDSTFISVHTGYLQDDTYPVIEDDSGNAEAPGTKGEVVSTFDTLLAHDDPQEMWRRVKDAVELWGSLGLHLCLDNSHPADAHDYGVHAAWWYEQEYGTEIITEASHELDQWHWYGKGTWCSFATTWKRRHLEGIDDQRWPIAANTLGFNSLYKFMQLQFSNADALPGVETNWNDPEFSRKKADLFSTLCRDHSEINLRPLVPHRHAARAINDGLSFADYGG